MKLVVGVGCSRGCSADELLALIDGALAHVDGEVVGVATIDLKADEPGIVEACRQRAWSLSTYDAAQLRAVAVPTPSATVERHVGTPSVAEAAASHSGPLIVTKQRSPHATCAIAAVIS